MKRALTVTAIFGIVMAIRFGRSRRAVCLLLAAGAALPVSLILSAWLA